jgi:hypothetical protein
MLVGVAVVALVGMLVGVLVVVGVGVGVLEPPPAIAPITIIIKTTTTTPTIIFRGVDSPFFTGFSVLLPPKLPPVIAHPL